MKTIRFAMIGLGNIGRNLLDILVHRRDAIAATYGLQFSLVGVADSHGAALCPTGLDMAALRDLKLARRSAADLPVYGRPGLSGLEMLTQVEVEIFVDASPTNVTDGEPGMSCVKAALGRGIHLVSASKGPLVLAYDELMSLAAAHGSRVLFSGTVAGGLPTVNIGMRDLVGSEVLRVEGIFNGTTNYILTRMANEHLSYAEAVRGAQAAGIAEADPTLDVDGWDAANKLVILANSVLRRPTRLQDVTIKGIRDLTLADLEAAAAQGQTIKPLAIAEKTGDDYVLRVEPTWLPLSHPLARTGMWDMAVVYYTDYMGVISAVIEEKGPVPTSAALLRDMLTLYC